MANEDLIKRVPPHSAEAEQACLGAMLVSQTAVNDVIEMLNYEDFFDDKHKYIFHCIIYLVEKGSPVDVITVSDQLKNIDQLAKIGGSAFLSSLIDNAPSYSNVKYYAQIIQDKAVLRSLINACRTIIDSVYEQQSNIERVSDNAERLVFEVTNRKLRSNYHFIKDAIPETLHGVERLSHSEHIYTGVPTGYKEFDDMTSGLQKGDMVVLAARPSMGKTAFALNIAANITKNHSDYHVLFFSLEMSLQELVLRLLSSESRLDMQKLRKGKLNESAGEWKHLVDAAGVLSSMNIIVDDTPGITLNEIRAKSRRVKSKFGLDILIVDHLQLITTSEKMSINRNNEISYISRNIKALAKELNIPIIILSQLSRSVESRSDHRPILSDLRESGAIEQDADVVAFLYREEYYNKESMKKNIAELLIQKQRNGPTGDIELLFSNKIVRFDNLDKHSAYLDQENHSPQGSN